MNDRLRWGLRRAAWGLLIFLILMVVVWTAGNIAGTSRFQAAVEVLRRNGIPTTLDGMAPPVVATAENAASFYLAAFGLLVDPPDPSPWGEEPDAQGMAELSREQLAGLDGWLKKNEEAIEMATRASRRPRCRFERDYTRGYMLLLPEAPKIVPLSRTLEYHARRQAQLGDPKAARESVRVLFALADSLRDEPVLVCQLIRMFVFNRGLETLSACVTSASTADDLEGWRALMPTESFLEGTIARALGGEAALATALVSSGMGREALVGSGGSWRCNPVLQPLLRWDGGHFLEQMARVIISSRKPYPQAAAETFGAGYRPHWSSLLCGPLMPAMGKVFERVGGLQAHAAVVRAGLGVELERVRTGRYPAHLEVLDPFTGRLLLYDPTAGSLQSGGMDENHPVQWNLRHREK
jgi:hypothetical protein